MKRLLNTTSNLLLALDYKWVFVGWLVGWWGRDVETVSAFKYGIKGESHHTLPKRDILIKHDLSSHRSVCSSAREVSLSCFKISTASWVFCPQISHIPASLQANFSLLRGDSEARQCARRKESVLRSCAQVGSQGNGKVGSKVEAGSVSRDLWQELPPGGPAELCTEGKHFYFEIILNWSFNQVLLWRTILFSG